MRSRLKGWYLVLPVLVADRVSKVLAEKMLSELKAVTAIPGIFSWQLTRNTGAAFSLMAELPWLTILLTAVLLIVLLMLLLRRTELPRFTRAGLWLVIAGGVSNLFDRIAYGAVVDFIRLDFIRFGIFNAADIAVCLGALLIAVGVLLGEGAKKKEK